jgi:hypothetical protein
MRAKPVSVQIILPGGIFAPLYSSVVEGNMLGLVL